MAGSTASFFFFRPLHCFRSLLSLDHSVFNYLLTRIYGILRKLKKKRLWSSNSMLPMSVTSSFSSFEICIIIIILFFLLCIFSLTRCSWPFRKYHRDQCGWLMLWKRVLLTTVENNNKKEQFARIGHHHRCRFHSSIGSKKPELSSPPHSLMAVFFRTGECNICFFYRHQWCPPFKNRMGSLDLFDTTKLSFLFFFFLLCSSEFIGQQKQKI